MLVNSLAGTGEHGVYPILAGPDRTPIVAHQHYLGIDAVSWYVNQQSGWFADRLASGTLAITLADGQERYELGLGVYELKGGAQVAPVFDRPVLPERAYRGGVVTVKALISGLSRDTRIARLIKTTATASLAVVRSMVETAGVTGPYAPLATAGSSLALGVQDLLTTTDQKLHLFDPSGIEVTLRNNQIAGSETYLLLHRGARLARRDLDVAGDTDTAVPLYGGEPLRDGVWLLLRLRRVLEFPRERPWLALFRRWLAQVTGLMDDARNKVISAEAAANALATPSDYGSQLYNLYREIRGEILNDGVLTQREAAAYAGTLSVYHRLAVSSLRRDEFDEFFDQVALLHSGTSTSSRATQTAYADELSAAVALRPGPDASPSGPPELDRRSVPTESLGSVMRHLPRLSDAIRNSLAR